jgi:hypothetical protein
MNLEKECFRIFREALASRRSSGEGIFSAGEDITSVEVPA